MKIGSGGDPVGAPRWVKVLVLAAAVLAGLLVVVMLVVGGDHGPGRHAAQGAAVAPAVAPVEVR